MEGLGHNIAYHLSGKMLVFPQETSSAHVRLTTSRQNLGAVTVCQRSVFSELTRDFSLFSLATPSAANDFLIFKKAPSGDISAYVRDLSSTFKGQDYQLNRWQSLCVTWDAASGLVQLWLDGKPSIMKYFSTSNISGPMIIVLGQEQDTYGGGFDIKQSFVGMMTDVHVWDYVLSPHHLDNYSQRFNFPEGNILNWRSIEFSIIGRVLLSSSLSSFCCPLLCYIF
uniref:Pentraxin family member n=1 Tax=Neogobius melanostomus TaxID=47308 RepID=A0A8C6SWL2_9GOBI